MNEQQAAIEAFARALIEAKIPEEIATAAISLVACSNLPNDQKRHLIAVMFGRYKILDIVGESIDPDTAITAFMGWLTSRQEVSGPFSGHHEAGSAVELMKSFFAAQGWESAPAERFERQIKMLREKYPD